MEAHERFSIRFYLLGILFLLFDVEALFLFPGRFATTPSGCSDSSR